ncbi:MAG: hypothetical protein AAFV88_04355 [Planctomycetota bacterium]
MFPANLMAPHVGQRGTKLSPRLWARLVETQMTADGGASGLMLYDDFNSFPNLTVTTAAGQLQPPSGYFAYIEADATVGSIKQEADKPSVITLTTSTDTSDGDNHDTILATNGNTGVLGMISDTAADAKLLVCEFRFRLPSVTNNDGSIFLGLGEEGLAAANTPIQDASGHTFSSDDIIGFYIDESDRDALNFWYRKAGSPTQELWTWPTALVADTWYNVGFVYDPSAEAGKRIKIFVNNEEQSSYVTSDLIAASTFPDGEELAMYAAIKGSANNDPQSVDLDFWAFYQAG